MKRNESNFIRMRKKHNKIKEILIRESVEKVNKKPVEVLDISVGRFGDLHKYIKAGVDYVVGIDPDEESIKEAESRLLHTDLNAELDIAKITEEKQPEIMKGKLFDIVVCNFTLHYFFKENNYLHNTFKNVTKCMRKGSYFIGTSIDGSKIESKETDYYKIQLKEKNAYTFELKDKEDTGIYKSPEDEYLVNIKLFIQIAKQYKLKCLLIKSFDHYKMNFLLKPWEKEISSMYFSFVFFYCG